MIDSQTLTHIVTHSQTIKHTRIWTDTQRQSAHITAHPRIVPDTQIQNTHAHTSRLFRRQQNWRTSWGTRYDVYLTLTQVMLRDGCDELFCKWISAWGVVCLV